MTSWNLVKYLEKFSLYSSCSVKKAFGRVVQSFNLLRRQKERSRSSDCVSVKLMSWGLPDVTCFLVQFVSFCAGFGVRGGATAAAEPCASGPDAGVCLGSDRSSRCCRRGRSQSGTGATGENGLLIVSSSSAPLLSTEPTKELTVI